MLEMIIMIYFIYEKTFIGLQLHTLVKSLLAICKQ